jgi:uncharacterized membrane protein YtjA (UPF0391 family)
MRGAPDCHCANHPAAPRLSCAGPPELSLGTAVFLTDAASAPLELLRRAIMLGWALTFLIVALIAAVLGFGGIAGLSIEIAKIIFFVAIVLFLISAIVGLFRGRTPTV